MIVELLWKCLRIFLDCNTLQAFKTQDPNGNGVPDEIPMLGKAGIINYLINGFVLYDQNITTETNYFVSGEKDPSNDEQWNEFMTTLKSIGREELVKVCQDAYTRQEK